MQKLTRALRATRLWFLILTALPVSTHALVVTSTADSGAGSLRDSITNAVDGDAITFSLPSGSTISLTSGELMINKNLTITGPGANQLTVARSSAVGTADARVFSVATGNFNVTISGFTIANGQSSTGGGIVDFNAGTLNITSCTISGNTSTGGTFGGGVTNSGTGTVNVTSCLVSGNSSTVALSGGGGGISNRNIGSLNITDSTISGNTASNDGGGISNFGATINVTRCAIFGNTAGTGGGVSNAATGTISIVNSTISGNSSTNSLLGGGGVSNLVTGTVNLTSVTIAGNSGGGGVTIGGGTVSSRNSIIAGNTGSAGPDVTGTLTSLGFNLVGNNTQATIAATTGDQIGTAATPIDPKLGPLADNGGPTKTRRLLFGSPAIDKGLTSVPITTDQRGFGRAVDLNDTTYPNASGSNASDIGAFELQRASLSNISTRAFVQAGQNVLIGGFINSGGGTKSLLLRALGPTLATFGLTPLADPKLELRDGNGTLIVSNDNWAQAANSGAIDPAMRPPNSAESAILTSLAAGNYTAIVRGASNGTGNALVEVYDLDTNLTARLSNISSRSFVQTGNNVLIAGFSVKGLDPDTVVVRALGPTLASFGISNPLPNPTLELYDGNGTLIASNNDWRATQQNAISATGLQPPNDSESAILRTLAPGNYTAIVRGVNNATGVAVVEVYDLN